MAAARKTTKRTGPAKAASAPTGNEPGLEEIRIKYDPVMIALSKATAARVLLVRAGEFFDEEEDVDWIEDFADAALVEALAEARAAYVKAAGDKPAPPEAAR